ncbi:MAG: sulfatase [Myxococcota bacterium]|nr:sulfatase [Myxococcota bacterium]MDW8362322.1 sulfatase [Myxococcales bacterium]
MLGRAGRAGGASPCVADVTEVSMARVAVISWIGAWALVACGGNGESGSATGSAATGSAASPGAAPTPAEFEGLSTVQDLVRTAHLADLDDGGLFIDFGTPQRDKYTTGDWKTGWIEDGVEGETTFTTVGATGRVYFHVDEPGPLTLRFRVRPIGTANMMVFVNNRQLETVRMQPGAAFRDHDVAVPAEAVQRGENYLLLRFGGTTRVGDRDVAVAMDWLRVVRGAPTSAEGWEPPTWGTLLGDAALGGSTRRAMRLRRGASASWYVQVPADGKLGLLLGAEGGPIDARVTLVPEGAESAELWSGRATGAWQVQLLDLSAHAGRIARIGVHAAGGTGSRLLVGDARVLVPARTVAAPARRPRNVVLLVIDTLRADKLRPWNPRSRVRTPVLDRLAAEGAVFERAHAPENWTKPSVASILSGLHPATHGAKTSEARLPASVLLLSEHLRAQGFGTASFIANGYVSDRFGFDQGWDHYFNYIRSNRPTEAEHLFRDAAAWIEQNRGKPFFVFIQTIDPHVPYDPPADILAHYDPRTDYAGQVRPRLTPDLLERAKRNPPAVTFDASDRRRLEALYDGEIDYHDRELGRFVERLQALGVWDETLIVITSDHGEEFGEHGSWGHGHSVYEEMLHVPFLWRGPGVPAVRVPHVVGTVDTAPTILALLGQPPMPDVEGRSLVDFLHGGLPPGPRLSFSDFLDDRRVANEGRFKLVLRGVNPTLFDLQTDPGEQRELPVGRHPIAMRFLRIHLGQFLGATNRARWLDAVQGQGRAVATEAAEMDPEIRRQLGALGYAN